jgi:hypothetical protein
MASTASHVHTENVLIHVSEIQNTTENTLQNNLKGSRVSCGWRVNSSSEHWWSYRTIGLDGGLMVPLASTVVLVHWLRRWVLSHPLSRRWSYRTRTLIFSVLSLSNSSLFLFIIVLLFHYWIILTIVSTNLSTGKLIPVHFYFFSCFTFLIVSLDNEAVLPKFSKTFLPNQRLFMHCHYRCPTPSGVVTPRPPLHFLKWLRCLTQNKLQQKFGILGRPRN